MTLRITTGVDIIEIARIEHAVNRFGDRFLHRIYTEGEIRHCRGRAQSLAGRFAAKEATSKALGVGIRILRWRDIEILPDARGKPTISLHGRAAEIATIAGLTAFDLSITHSRTDAVAMVIGWSEGTE